VARAKKTNRKNIPVNDRTIFFSDLSYFPPELKNETWCAQVIYYAKKYGKRFLDPKRAVKYRKTDLLELNDREYRQMFDPITPEGGGGQAKYISSDMKANPIYIHLMNTMRAEIQRTGKQIEANFTDKYSKTRKMRDSYKALYSRQIRYIINDFCNELGIPGISESQDPYKWIKNFAKQQEPGNEDKEMGSDVVGKFTDLIKNRIESNEDLILYNEMIYKGDYEQAIEKGISYYMFQLNRWEERWADEIYDSIRHFNKGCLEWYTDRITGRPAIEGLIPELLWTSPFRRKDGSDIEYYFREFEVTFADFVKTVGFGLKPEKLKQVFMWNKMQGSRHGLDWRDEWFSGPSNLRDNAYIRLGRCGVLSQDYEVFMDGVEAKYPKYQSPNGLSWKADPDNQYDIKREDKNYNVWRTFYYIPPTQQELANADYAWQANFIFDIRKNQDQFRYGEDGRYSQCPLVVYDNSRQASTTDIVESYMPKINFAWQSYQNCLINDVDATILSDEFMAGLLSAVDEENVNNPGEGNEPTGGNERMAAQEQWKMIRQAGKGFIKMVDKQGKPLMDPSKLVLVYKNGYLERADKFAGQMMNLYNQMNIALGNDPNASKPRVNKEGILEGVKGSDNSKWFMQKGYEFIIKACAERFVRYLLMVTTEAKELGYTERYDEFKSILGVTDGLLIEGLEDVPPEEIGLNLSFVDNKSMKDFVIQLCNQYVAQGKIDDDIFYLILGMDNWKAALCLVKMSLTKKKKEMAAQQELLHQQKMEEKDADLKIAMALNDSKAGGKDRNIEKQGEVDARLKTLEDQLKSRTMHDQKDQISDNRMRQDEQKAHLQRGTETFNALSPQTAGS
jgi:hypothetical protein